MSLVSFVADATAVEGDEEEEEEEEEEEAKLALAAAFASFLRFLCSSYGLISSLLSSSSSLSASILCRLSEPQPCPTPEVATEAESKADPGVSTLYVYLPGFDSLLE